MDRSHRLFRGSILTAILSATLASCASAATITWRNAVSGSWHTASNWLPTSVPGPGDVAVIALSGNYTVSINSNVSVDAINLASGTGTRRLNVNGATLTMSAGIAVGSTNYLTLNSGTVSGAGTIDVDGNLTSSGNSAINSPINTHFTTMFSVAGDSLKISAGFQNIGTLQFSNTNPVYLFVNGTLTNTGTIQSLNLSANTARLQKGSVNNQGTLDVQGSFSIEDITVSHQNSGTIDVGTNGYAVIRGGNPGITFTTSGNITIGSGATFEFARTVGVMTDLCFYQTAGSISGAGRLRVAGGGVTFASNPTCGEIELDVAKAVFPQTLYNQDSVYSYYQVLDFKVCDVTAPYMYNRGDFALYKGSVYRLPRLINWGTVTTPGPGTAAVQMINTQYANHFGGSLYLTTSLVGLYFLENVGYTEFGSDTPGETSIEADHIWNSNGLFRCVPGAGGTRRLPRIHNSASSIMDIQQTTVVGMDGATINDHCFNFGSYTVNGGDLIYEFNGFNSQQVENTGSYSIGAGRIVRIVGGHLNSTGSISGAGFLILDSGNIADFQMNPTVGRIAVRQATATLASAVTHGAAQFFELVDATVTAPGFTVESLHSLELHNSHLVVPALTNNGVVTVRQTGSVSGLINTVPGSRISMVASSGFGPASLTVGQAFANHGEITLEPVPNSSASLSLTNGELTNANGATIAAIATNPTDLTQAYLNASLNNNGLVAVNADLTLDRESAQHISSGSITVGEGDLRIRQTGTSPSFTSVAGTIWINPDRTLHVDGGAITVNGGSVTGGGTMNLTGGSSANFSVQPEISALNMQNADATFPGTFNTDSTSIDLDASDLIAGVTNTAGHTIRVLDSSISGSILNSGTLDVQGASSFPAFLSNGGLITIQNGLLLSGGDTGQLNYGVIRVLGGTFVVNQTPAGYFSNTDTLKVYPGATLQVTGGTFRNETAGVLAGGGTLDMSGTTFINNGTINPGASPGLLNITGNVSFGSTAVLNMELGGLAAGTQYDAIQISGDAVLNGTINLSLVNGFFPQPGNAFDLVTCGSHSGGFTNVNGTGAGFGNQLTLLQQPGAPIRVTTINQSWSAVFASGGPARSRHVSAFTGPSNRLIVFGGLSSGGEQNDTWALEEANGTGGGSLWNNLHPAGMPPAPRYDHAAAYDAVNNRLIVYGGFSSVPPYGFSDVWVLSNANGLGGTPTWTELTPGGGTPGPRGGSDVAYNPASNRLILFGGVHPDDACTYASNDVWILTNANGLGGTPVWSLLSTSGQPPYPRSGAVVSYDSATNRLILHGGTDACASELAEARVLTHADGLGGTPTWTTLPLAGPPVRTEHAGIYDAQTDRLITFGGLDALGDPLQDVFLITSAMNAGSAGWSALPVPPGGNTPVARSGHTLSWDPLSRRAILYGGESGVINYLSDVRILQLTLDGGPVSGVTDPVPPAPTPDPERDITRIGFMKAPWPNPANGPMSVTFGVPAAAEVTVNVFDVSGRPVRRLFTGMAAEGSHEISWNGEGDRGPVPSGIYYIVLRSGNVRDMQRIVVTR